MLVWYVHEVSEKVEIKIIMMFQQNCLQYSFDNNLLYLHELSFKIVKKNISLIGNS